jgi:hypothetical protein
MRRKRSIPDTVSAGRSRTVPYVLPRRGLQNAPCASSKRKSGTGVQRSRWCGQRRVTLRITNEGHHWQITDGSFLAEWPSSAKLVMDKKWHDEIHCHDYKQALKVIEDFHRKKRL